MVTLPIISIFIGLRYDHQKFAYKLILWLLGDAYILVAMAINCTHKHNLSLTFILKQYSVLCSSLWTNSPLQNIRIAKEHKAA